MVDAVLKEDLKFESWVTFIVNNAHLIRVLSDQMGFFYFKFI
jgi:hypothetical protein